MCKNKIIFSVLIFLIISFFLCKKIRSEENNLFSNGNQIEEYEIENAVSIGKIIDNNDKYVINNAIYEIIEGVKVEDNWYLYESSVKNIINFNEKYGNLFIKYQRQNYNFIYYNNSLHFPITEAEYYYKKNDKMYYLGKQNLNGIYNKDNILIFEIPKTNTKIIGYDSMSLLENPFNNTCCCFDAKENYIYLSDSFVVENIDFENDTITTTPLKY